LQLFPSLLRLRTRKHGVIAFQEALDWEDATRLVQAVVFPLVQVVARRLVRAEVFSSVQVVASRLVQAAVFPSVQVAVSLWVEIELVD
jgi:hypothetical protein